MMLLCLILLTVLPIGQSEKPETKEMTCTDTLPEDFDDACLIMCPSICDYECKGKVMGSGPYHKRSPPCCSCKHSRCPGGCMKITKEAGEKSYSGSTRNGVESMDCEGSDWSYSCKPCEPPTTTPEPVTPEPTTPEPVTPEPTTPESSTFEHTTIEPVNPEPTTPEIPNDAPCPCDNPETKKTAATTKKSTPAPPSTGCDPCDMMGYSH